MTYTPTQLASATVAVLNIVQADISKEVPAMFQSQIPQVLVRQFAADAAKAALDAAVS